MGIRAVSFANHVFDGSLAQVSLPVRLACVAVPCLKKLVSSESVNQP